MFTIAYGSIFLFAALQFISLNSNIFVISMLAFVLLSLGSFWFFEISVIFFFIELCIFYLLDHGAPNLI